MPADLGLHSGQPCCTQPGYRLWLARDEASVVLPVPSVHTVASALERLAETHSAVHDGVDGTLAAEYQVFHIDPSGAGRPARWSILDL